MNIDEIKQLIQLMVDNELSELDVSAGEAKYTFKRGSAPAPIMTAAPMAAMQQVPVVAAAPVAAAAPAASTLVEIRSPMVGTFYSAPSPDSDAFVKVGMSVSEDSPVCIIEAMKVMNEIKAECSGSIAEICVKNAQPVEYGQVLFRVKPA